MQTKYTIRVTGTAKANTALKNFDVKNVWTDDSDFVEYMRDGELKDKLVGESYLTFELVGRSLTSVVEYHTNVKLTKSELNKLADYTQGQWSDGIGECFEQNPCGTTNSGKDLYISPWHVDQVVKVEQVKN